MRFCISIQCDFHNSFSEISVFHSVLFSVLIPFDFEILK